MCNRYTLHNLAALHELLAELGIAIVPAAEPRYNVALTTRMPALVVRDEKPELEVLPFGFVLPHGPGGKPMLLGNARAETVLQKPSFRDAVRHRRCLVPADGFYEWEKAGRDRLPHYFQVSGGRPFFMAGLWQPETDRVPAGFAVLTTEPNDIMRPVHTRMPVILDTPDAKTWLGRQPLPEGELQKLCRPFDTTRMTRHRVDPRMNSVRYTASDCIAPYTDRTPVQGTLL